MPEIGSLTRFSPFKIVDLAYAKVLQILGNIDPHTTQLIQILKPYYLDKHFTYLLYLDPESRY